MASKGKGETAMATSETRAVTRFELPKPVTGSTPIHGLQNGEALVNSVIVLRGVGPRMDLRLGPCRAIYFQFPHDYEDIGPIKGGGVKDANGEWVANFPDDADDGVWSFLVSDTSPACRKAKEIMGEFMESRGTAARLATVRRQQSQLNPGQSYYVLDAPQEGDLFADRDDVSANITG